MRTLITTCLASVMLVGCISSPGARTGDCARQREALTVKKMLVSPSMDENQSGVVALAQGSVCTIIAFVEDPDPRLRSAAARAIMIRGDRDLLGFLYQLIDDDDRYVQMAAFGALGRLGSRFVISRLEPYTDDEDGSVALEAQNAINAIRAREGD